MAGRDEFPVRMCLRSHTLRVPVIIRCQSHGLGRNSESFRDSVVWISRSPRTRKCATSTQIPPPPPEIDVPPDFHLPAPPPPALPIKVSVLILALFCNTHGHESALLRIALVRPLWSGERRLINNTALLTPGLVAEKTDANRQ